MELKESPSETFTPNPNETAFISSRRSRLCDWFLPEEMYVTVYII